jgi:hypothetical protein
VEPQPRRPRIGGRLVRVVQVRAQVAAHVASPGVASVSSVSRAASAEACSWSRP